MGNRVGRLQRLDRAVAEDRLRTRGSLSGEIPGKFLELVSPRGSPRVPLFPNTAVFVRWSEDGETVKRMIFLTPWNRDAGVFTS